MIRKILQTFILFLTVIAVHAQDIEVSIVTCYPGSDIYELEGHTALRITTPQSDFAVSYGTFDFDAPNFAYRFVKGETDYWVTAVPFELFKQAYIQQGRRIVERKLNLSDSQKNRLQQVIQTNFLPENRTYRYNYLHDNCATRPMLAVTEALGDTISYGKPADDIAPLKTWREVMRHYHTNYPWYQLGIDLVLGYGLDAKISNSDKNFAPAALDSSLALATVNGEPLVSNTVILNDVPADNAVLPPTPWYATPLAVFSLILALTTIICIFAYRRNRQPRVLYTIMYVSYTIAGCVIAFLVFCSSHPTTSPNLNLLWLNPLYLIPAICIWIKPAKKLVYLWQIVNFVLLIALACLWPILPQVGNVAFIPIASILIVLDITYIAIYTRQCRIK